MFVLLFVCLLVCVGLSCLVFYAQKGEEEESNLVFYAQKEEEEEEGNLVFYAPKEEEEIMTIRMIIMMI